MTERIKKLQYLKEAFETYLEGSKNELNPEEMAEIALTHIENFIDSTTENNNVTRLSLIKGLNEY